MARITSLRPGHKPPHVTIPHVSADGSKNNLCLGPADSIAGGVEPFFSQGLIPSRVEWYSTRSSSRVNRTPEMGDGMRHSPSRAIVKSRSSFCIDLDDPRGDDSSLDVRV